MLRFCRMKKMMRWCFRKFERCFEGVGLDSKAI